MQSIQEHRLIRPDLVNGSGDFPLERPFGCSEALFKSRLLTLSKSGHRAVVDEDGTWIGSARDLETAKLVYVKHQNRQINARVALPDSKVGREDLVSWEHRGVFVVAVRDTRVH